MEWACRWIKEKGHSIAGRDGAITAPAAIKKVLRDQLRSLTDKKMDKLFELGIVEPSRAEASTGTPRSSADRAQAASPA